jgi:primosomal protein N' (replication factor Y)
VAEVAQMAGTALIIAPDVAAAARWARRLQALRLDSGASAETRRHAWFAAARGRARTVVGTRSALLTPLPPPATLVLLDEHDVAHRPPGAPRMHSADLLRERAAVEGCRLLLLSGAPSCEAWWRSEQGEIGRIGSARGPWPDIVTPDTRGVLRHHPLTAALTRAIREGTRDGRRMSLIASRSATALGCDDCGAIVRCPDCGIALAHDKGAAVATCRLCSRREPAPATCAGCGGHRLAPFGWSAERVEAAVARRFPRLRVARVAPGAAAPSGTGVDVMIGTAAVLRSLPPRSLGGVGFISLDGLLQLPDFRAGERVFQALWTAAEAVGPRGRLVVQTLHPDHHAIAGVRRQDHSAFYAVEIASRRDLGYPPFRRLCVMTARSREPAAALALAEECAAVAREVRGLTVYAHVPAGGSGARSPRWQVVVKGPLALPSLLAEPLRSVLERGRRAAGMIEVEMDPLSLS